MDRYVTLLGAEQVSRAAGQMAEAAREMRSAASNLESMLHHHRRWMDDWLMRFQEALEKVLEGALESAVSEPPDRPRT